MDRLDILQSMLYIISAKISLDLQAFLFNCQNYDSYQRHTKRKYLDKHGNLHGWKQRRLMNLIRLTTLNLS